MSLIDLLQSRLEGGRRISEQLDEEERQRQLAKAAKAKKSKQTGIQQQIPATKPKQSIISIEQDNPQQEQQKEKTLFQKLDPMTAWKEKAEEIENKQTNERLIKIKKDVVDLPDNASWGEASEHLKKKGHNIERGSLADAALNYTYDPDNFPKYAEAVVNEANKKRQTAKNYNKSIEEAQKYEEENQKAQKNLNLLRGIGGAISPIGGMIDTMKNEGTDLVGKLSSRIKEFSKKSPEEQGKTVKEGINKIKEFATPSGREIFSKEQLNKVGEKERKQGQHDLLGLEGVSSKEKLSAVMKFPGYVAYGIADLSKYLMPPEQRSDKTGPEVFGNDVSPSTPGEAKVMQFGDIVFSIPNAFAGRLRSVASNIVRANNEKQALSILKNLGIKGSPETARLVMNTNSEKEASELVNNLLGTMDKKVVNPINLKLKPSEKVQKLVELSKENIPDIENFVKSLDKELGTKSQFNLKKPENILSKSERPEIRAQKPWFGVEHIRDGVRFKTGMNSFDDFPKIMQKVRDRGWEVTKLDTNKMKEPGKWGWRFGAVDLKMPNGQLAEYYFSPKEIIQANDNEAHALFEKWRNIPETERIKNPQYFRDLEKSNQIYSDAYSAFLKRVGSDDAAASASWTNLSSSEESLMLDQSSISSSADGAPLRQSPLASRMTDNSSVATQKFPNRSRAVVNDLGINGDVNGLQGNNSTFRPKSTINPLLNNTSEERDLFQDFPDLSTKILGKLQGRREVSKQFISDLTKSGDVKQVERDLINKTLERYPDRVPVNEFANDVKTELLPLKLKSNKKRINIYEGRKLIEAANRRGDFAEAERITNEMEKSDLSFGTRYEHISLPKRIRGNVANYDEHIWESPVKTSAGDIHFNGASENYFGHTRVEDIADNVNELKRVREGISEEAFKGLGLESKTRRVIELQSDLYQKGNLENAELDELKRLNKNKQLTYDGKQIDVTSFPYKEFDTAYARINGKETTIDSQKLLNENNHLLKTKKLQQYNNPTAHFRMVREEVQQAIKDGKTKLQFPTGETAMNIEGLGDTSHQWNIGPSRTPSEIYEQGPQMRLEADKLKVGLEINNAGGGSDWIVTDVLGDGKFKAISRNAIEEIATDAGLKEMPENIGSLLDDFNNFNMERVDNLSEQFDISGKIDTENPIYKFYEKDLGKYLKNNYNISVVTDKQGVTWNEINLNNIRKKGPVEAFGVVAGFQQDENGDFKFNPEAAAAGVLMTGGLRRVKPGKVQSKVIASAEENSFISNTIKKELETRGFYAIRNTNELIVKSKNLVNDFPDVAERVFKSRGDDVAIAIGEELIKKFSETGQSEKALDLIEMLSKKGTAAGRGTQIFSAFGKLSPEDVGRFAQRQIDIANEKFGLNIKMTTDQYNKFYDAAKELKKLPDGYDKQVETAKLIRDIYGLIPSSNASKIGLGQTIMQLLNKKTIIRNIGGNLMFGGGLENISQAVATPLDKLMNLVTGKRTVAMPNPFRQGIGAAKGLYRGSKEAWQGINTMGLGSQFDLPQRRVFRNKVFSFLEKTMSVSLQGPDRAAYTAAFEDTLTGLMNANNVRKAEPWMIESAHHQGLYRTFQDNSIAAKGFTKLKEALNTLVPIIKSPDGKTFGGGDFLIKYPKTPGNIIARGFDYTPLGFAKTMFEGAKPLFKKPFNQEEFVRSFSRALVGTVGLTGIGFTLAKLGIITGPAEKDKDIRALQRDTGTGAYRINVSGLKRFVMSGLNPDAAKQKDGDFTMTYDWAQPMAIPVSLGARIANDKEINIKNLGDVALGSVESGINTLQEQPMLTGIRRLFGGGGLMGGIQSTAQGVATSFIPTVSNQIKQFFDNRARETYDPSMIKESWNLVKNKVPGLAQTLPVKTDAWGEEMENYQMGSNNIWNVFLNPSFVGTIKNTPESQMVFDIYEKSGESKQFPRVQPTTIKVSGEDKVLTTGEYIKFQKYVGEATTRIFKNLAIDKSFRALSPEEQANELSNVMTDIGKSAKKELFGEQNDGKTVDELIIKQEKLSGFRGIQAVFAQGDISKTYEFLDSMSLEDQKMFGTYKSQHDELKNLNPYTIYDNPVTQKRENTTVFKNRLMSDNPEEGIKFLKRLEPEEQERITNLLDNKGNEDYLNKYNEIKGIVKSVSAAPREYQMAIADASKNNGVPENILTALLKQESNFNPDAKSPSGAVGIAQFMPDTAKQLGIDPLNPQEAIGGAAKYLKAQYDKFGSWEKAVAAYNAGPNNVEKYDGIPPFPETQNYVDKIMSEVSDDTPVAHPYVLGSYDEKIDKMIKSKKVDNAFEKLSPNPISVPSKIDKAATDYMFDQYPFTDEAKKRLTEKMNINITGEINNTINDNGEILHAGGHYIRSEKETPGTLLKENEGKNQEIDIDEENIIQQYNEGKIPQRDFYEKMDELEEKRKSLAVGIQSTDKYKGENRIYANSGESTAAHEALHSYFSENGLSTNPTVVDNFNSVWEEEAKNNKLMQDIDKVLTGNKLYSRRDKYSTANERFAYLGGYLGQDGLEAFPEPLKQYYQKVFKSSKDTGVDIDERKKLKDEADQIVTMMDNGEISEQDARQLLNNIDNKLNKYSFSEFLNGKRRNN